MFMKVLSFWVSLKLQLVVKCALIVLVKKLEFLNYVFAILSFKQCFYEWTPNMSIDSLLY